MASQEDALKSGTDIKGEVFKTISFLEFRTESKVSQTKTSQRPRAAPLTFWKLFELTPVAFVGSNS
jgi:hypothetical protein